MTPAPPPYPCAHCVGSGYDPDEEVPGPLGKIAPEDCCPACMGTGESSPIARAIAEHVTPPVGEPFNPGRYPSTYSCDIVRKFPAVIGLDPARSIPSRAEASVLIRGYAASTEQDILTVKRALADAYLMHFRVETSPEERESAFAAYRTDLQALAEIREGKRCVWCREVVSMDTRFGLLVSSRDQFTGSCVLNPYIGRNVSYAGKHMLVGDRRADIER